MNDTLPKHRNVVEVSDDNIHRCYPDIIFKRVDLNYYSIIQLLFLIILEITYIQISLIYVNDVRRLSLL